jgi:hypothetical protein
LTVVDFLFAARSIGSTIAVIFGIIGQPRNRNNAFPIVYFENYDTLATAPRDPDTTDRTAYDHSGIGH